MKLKKQLFVLILLVLSVLFLCQPILSADTDPTPVKKRPAPEFDHTRHETALEEPGCGACHHILDDTSRQLIYSEGDESDCSECHAPAADNNVPALREASHASCTACHRDLKKKNKPAGPTTCGECHKK